MIVLLDAGNSRFKWCRLQNGVLSRAISREYGSQDRARAVVAVLETQDKPQRIVVASVLRDDFRDALTTLSTVHLGVTPEFVVPASSAYGVRVAYANPKEFGADRFAALVAARQSLQAPCIVVDCGTAVTIDALTSSGEHLGGLILPGFELMRRSLIEQTARINAVPGSDDYHLFGRSTAQGVRAGTLRALVSAIDRITQDMAVHLIQQCGNGPPKRVLTGGAGAYLLPYLAADYQLEPSLVLQGTAIIAQEGA
jgi:type III pantothenate kinase